VKILFMINIMWYQYNVEYFQIKHKNIEVKHNIILTAVMCKLGIVCVIGDLVKPAGSPR